MRFSGVNNQKKQCKCKKKNPNLYQSISERKSFNNLLYKYRFLVKNCIHLIFVYLQIHLIVIPPKPEHWLNFVTIFKIHCVNTFDRAVVSLLSVTHPISWNLLLALSKISNVHGENICYKQSYLQDEFYLKHYKFHLFH